MKKYKPFFILIVILLAGSLLFFYINKNNSNKQSVYNQEVAHLDQEWKDLLKDIFVPSKYSIKCDSNDKCMDYYYINGEMPANIQKNTPGYSRTPIIDLILNQTETGTLDLDGKKVEIAMIPYSMCASSCGSRVYVIQKKEKAEVIANIDSYKDNIDKIEIKNDKIRVIIGHPTFPQDESYTIECFFEDGKLDGDFLKCNYLH